MKITLEGSPEEIRDYMKKEPCCNKALSENKIWIPIESLLFEDIVEEMKFNSLSPYTVQGYVTDLQTKINDRLVACVLRCGFK